MSEEPVSLLESIEFARNVKLDKISGQALDALVQRVLDLDRYESKLDVSAFNSSI